MNTKSSILSKEEYLKKFSMDAIKLINAFQKEIEDGQNIIRLEKIVDQLEKIKAQLIIIINNPQNDFVLKLDATIQRFQKQLDAQKKKSADSALDFLKEDISEEARKKLLEQESPFASEISSKIPKKYGGKTDTY